MPPVITNLGLELLPEYDQIPVETNYKSNDTRFLIWAQKYKMWSCVQLNAVKKYLTKYLTPQHVNVKCRLNEYTI